MSDQKKKEPKLPGSLQGFIDSLRASGAKVEVVTMGADEAKAKLKEAAEEKHDDCGTWLKNGLTDAGWMADAMHDLEVIFTKLEPSIAAAALGMAAQNVDAKENVAKTIEMLAADPKLYDLCESAFGFMLHCWLEHDNVTRGDLKKYFTRLIAAAIMAGSFAETRNKYNQMFGPGTPESTPLVN